MSTQLADADSKVGNDSPQPRLTLRDAGFARRLEQACDASFECPGVNKGRLTWIAAQLGKRMGQKVAIQTVARWMNGEAKPRQAKNVALAELLGVDPLWLYHGAEPDMSPRERRIRNATADGIVNVIAGLIQMDGGSPAFPEEKDTRAEREHIDLYAVIKGANYSFHVAMGRKQNASWDFTVPAAHDNVVILGVIRDGFSLRIVELSEEIFEEHGTSAGKSIILSLGDDVIDNQEITTFAQRL